MLKQILGSLIVFGLCAPILAQSSSPWGCRPFLERIAEPEDAETIMATNKPYEVLAHKAHKQVVEGLDSQVEFSPYWHFYLGDGDSVETKLEFYYQKAGSDKGPSMVLKPDGLDENHHLLEFEFPRNFEGQMKDIEILEGAFGHLHRVSAPSDTYTFHISDAVIIEQLNAAVNYHLESLPVDTVPLIRASEDQHTNPLQGEYEFDPYRDSYFSGLTIHQLRDVLKRLDSEEIDVSAELTRAFLKTRLGKAIQESGVWWVRVDMIPDHLNVPRNSAEQDVQPVTSRVIYKVSISLL